MAQGITWLGHASFKLTNSAVVYIDPWKIQAKDNADVILITHSHHDHCSPEDVSKLAGEKTIIVGPPECASKFLLNFRPVSPGTKLTLGKVSVTAVPAYNPGKQFHPKKNNWVGYVVAIGGRKIYHAGDTDVIPEMKALKDMAIDYALLPVGGTYTMDAAQAAEAANIIQPKVAIPMHFGTIVGGAPDAERFKKLCTVPVEILTPRGG